MSKRKHSVAQEVADWLQHQAAYTEFTISQYWPTQLLREDRQRRQMERAIVAWSNSDEETHARWKVECSLHKIARRLRGKK